MICPHCNAFVPDDAPLCPECGTAFHNRSRGFSLFSNDEYRNTLPLSIVLTVVSALCCLNPLTIVFGGLAVAFSAIAKDAFEHDEQDKARRHTRYASCMLLIWCIITLLSPLLLHLLPQILKPIFALLERLTSSLTTA